MTSINTRMFDIMFEVSLLVASLKISTFINTPLFIHTSENKTLIHVTAYAVVNSKTCSCERAKIKPPHIKISAKSIVGQKTAKPLHVLLNNLGAISMHSIVFLNGQGTEWEYFYAPKGTLFVCLI